MLQTRVCFSLALISTYRKTNFLIHRPDFWQQSGIQKNMIVLGASRRSLLSFSPPMLLSQNFCRNCQNLQGTVNSTPGTSEVGSINRISVSPKRGHLFRGTVLGLLLHSLNFSFSSLFQGKRVNYMIYLYHDPCVVFSLAFSVGGIWFYSL